MAHADQKQGKSQGITNNYVLGQNARLGKNVYSKHLIFIGTLDMQKKSL